MVSWLGWRRRSTSEAMAWVSGKVLVIIDRAPKTPDPNTTEHYRTLLQLVPWSPGLVSRTTHPTTLLAMQPYQGHKALRLADNAKRTWHMHTIVQESCGTEMLKCDGM